MAPDNEDRTQQGYSPADFWGEEVWSEGYVALPRRLLLNAARLGLKPEELALLAQLLGFKMTANDPFPSNETLAERMGVSLSTVKRYRHRVEKVLGLAQARSRRGSSNRYDLSPLAEAVRRLPPVRSSATQGVGQGRPGGRGRPRPGTRVTTDPLTRTTEEHETEKEQHNNVIASLQREGVKGSVAIGLFADYREEACRRQLDWLPHRNARDPAAMLVESIRGGWGPPKTSPRRVDDWDERMSDR